MERVVKTLGVALVALFPFVGPWAGEPTQEPEPSVPPIEKLPELSLEELQEITVEVAVASLFRESELDAASTVSVVTAKGWRATPARRTYDPLELLPGTQIVLGSSGEQAVQFRGFSASTPKGIAQLLDGVPMNDFAFGTALYAFPNTELGVLDRMEVIRGPGSALYGTDAFHGVISMRSWSLTGSKQALESNLDYGSFGFYQGGLRAGKEVLPELRLTFDFGLSGQSNVGLAYGFDDRAGGLLTNKERRYFQSKTLLTKVAYRNAEAMFGYLSFESNGFPGTYANTSSVGIGIQGGFPKNYAYVGQLSDRIAVTDLIDVEPRIYYWQANFAKRFGLDNGPEDASATKVSIGVKESRAGLNVNLKKRPSESFPVKALFGYSLDVFKILDAPYFDPAYLSTTLTLRGAGRTVSGVYAEADAGFFDDRVHLVGGTRFDSYSDFGSALSPRAGLIYHPDDDSSVKFLYGHAFTAPAAAEELGSSPTVAPNPGLSPETIDTYELNYMRKNRIWKTSATLFGTHWRNGITVNSLPGSPPFTQYQNLALLKSYGAEGEVGWNRGQLESFLNLTYVRSRQTEPTIRDFSAYPVTTLNFGASYAFRHPKLQFALQNHFQFARSSNSGSLGAAPVPLSPFYRTDLTAAWGIWGTLELVGKIQNLLNRRNFQPSIWSWNPNFGVLEPGINGTLGLRATL